MTRALYEGMDGIRWSLLKHMLRSAAHFRAAETCVIDDDTTARRIGRCFHMATLEPERFAGVAVWQEGVRRGKAWDAFVEAAGDREILSREEHAQCSAMAEAVRNSPALKYLEAAQVEVPISWEVEGVRAKGIPDAVSIDGFLSDLKSCGDASPEAFGRDVLRMHYLAQLAWYVDGWKAAHGVDLEPVLIAVETKAPHCVGVYRVRPEQIDLGRSEYRRALELLKQCRASGKWPGYGGEQDLLLPKWAGITNPENYE
jgi:exodeoxyribonuclease VIII